MRPKILFDSQTVHMYAHLGREFDNDSGGTKIYPEEKDFRLKTFFAIVEEYGEILISNNKIDPNLLSNVDLFVILTRMSKYYSSELDSIFSFVKNGGSLLLMSNHDPVCQWDAEVAEKFGVVLEGGYWSGIRGKSTEISKENFTDHPILAQTNPPIGSIVTNTTCRIVSEKGNIIVYLPDTMVEGIDKNPIEPKNIFGLELNSNYSNQIGGKIVILADSGFLGEQGSRFPGLGLIEEGDNLAFIKNILEYLVSVD